MTSIILIKMLPVVLLRQAAMTAVGGPLTLGLSVIWRIGIFSLGFRNSAFERYYEYYDRNLQAQS